MMTYISLLLLIIHSQKIGTYKLWLFVSNINRNRNSKNKVNTHKNERFNKVWQVYTILKNGVLFLYILFIWQIGLYQFIKKKTMIQIYIITLVVIHNMLLLLIEDYNLYHRSIVLWRSEDYAPVSPTLIVVTQ